jgi:hypothetical protein
MEVASRALNAAGRVDFSARSGVQPAQLDTSARN